MKHTVKIDIHKKVHDFVLFQKLVLMMAASRSNSAAVW